MWSRLSVTTDLGPICTQRYTTFVPLPFAKKPERRTTRCTGDSCGGEVLAEQPHVGRLVEDMDTAFREWPIEFGDSGYIALYHFDGETATILAVRHQKEAGY
jgi:hypothetical protein